MTVMLKKADCMTFIYNTGKDATGHSLSFCYPT